MNKIVKTEINYVTEELVVTRADGTSESLPLYEDAAFREISRLWLNTGWNLKFSYNYTWWGRPIIQMPEDMVAFQELIFRVQPDVIIETGVAHGGSSVFFASLLELLGKGRVLSIDILIRPHNRKAIETHPMKKRITLIERSSIDPVTIEEVSSFIAPGEKVMVFLDSNHSKGHVAEELKYYSRFVTPGSYMLVADTLLDCVFDVPNGKPAWLNDSPRPAALEFVKAHPEFEIDPLLARFGVTYFPDGFLKRVG
jgi:cephalosporin hydroxylase